MLLVGVGSLYEMLKRGGEKMWDDDILIGQAWYKRTLFVK